jgi:hypothetical protein
VTWELELLGFLAGLVVATLTAPVGVSGAVSSVVSLAHAGVP